MGLPVEVNNLMMGSLGGYTVGRSLRFRASASAYLNRTPAAASNRQTWTWSGWVKRGSLSSTNGDTIFCAGDGTSSNRLYLYFSILDTLAIISTTTASPTILRDTTAVFRDPSAWYHIVIAFDTTQATANNRLLVYVNGVQITAFGTTNNLAQNANSYVNNNIAHRIGNAFGTGYFDGYLSEVNFIDGQQLTPSSFGAYDTNGVWQPKKYTGTYGTNGFYLPFSDTTSTTTLVQDSSGNSNNFTPNNISLTAGVTYDSMIDSPTVDLSASNYCTINPLSVSGATLSNANLKSVVNGASFGTIGVSSGKWYWETLWSAGGTATVRAGIFNTAATPSTANARGDTVYSYCYTQAGNKRNNGTNTSYGASFSTGDIIATALDLDAGTVTWYKNGVSQGVAFTGLSGTFTPEFSAGTANATLEVNFGQRPFTYTPPTGFNALNTYNLPLPSISAGNKHFDISLWTGTGVAQAITNSGSFQPDLVWNKSRNNAGLTHIWTDSVRGVNSQLFSPLTNAQETRTDRLQSFNSNGFTVGTYTDVNQSAQTFVGWQWKGGGTGVTNTSGTITSTVSANPTAGFSIVTYTGNGSAGATIGHGLGVAPNLIIVKSRPNVTNWPIYNSNIGAGSYLQLNTTIAATADSTIWNSTSPTSSVFTVGVSGGVNLNAATYVAYCFAAISGYSAFGSYTGNGSNDGPFIYTGFNPRWILLKQSSAAGSSWIIWDIVRQTYNVLGPALYPDLSNAESTPASSSIDFLSSGFKLRNGTGTATNGSGSTYIYAAFAENPFKYSRAR